MKEGTQIEHKGIVKEVGQSELKVSIVSATSCASCELKGSCNPSDIEEKIIEVPVASPTDYKKGQPVNLFYKQSLGFRALFLGYLLPFLIVISSLITVLEITHNEGIAGLTAIGLLAPYYLTLYLLKGKIKKTFAFSIEKINTLKEFNLNHA